MGSAEEEEGGGILFKIVLLGDSAVGKSNLLSRYVRNDFDSQSKATIGVEFQTTIVEVGGKEIRVQIWDTAGQERFRAVISSYYRGADGALLVYDITNKETFDNANSWLDELNVNCSTTKAKVLIGNKIDLVDQRMVATKDAKSFAEQKSMSFFETSAFDSTNVKQAFDNIIASIYSEHSLRKKTMSDSHKDELCVSSVSLLKNGSGSSQQNKLLCCGIGS